MAIIGVDAIQAPCGVPFLSILRCDGLIREAGPTLQDKKKKKEKKETKACWSP